MGLLDVRDYFKPFEYPEYYEIWIKAHAAHWSPFEVQLSGDIEDWKSKLTENEKNVVGNILKGFVAMESHVEDYWSSKVGSWFKKSEIQMLAHTFASFECFDDQTELLTSLGWINVKDILAEHRIAQYDLLTSSISFELPKKVVSYKYKGKMHHYKSLTTDICVTPNHDLITIHPSSRKVTKQKSEGSLLGNNYLYPTSGRSMGIDSKLSTLERLLIAVQADGSLFGTTKSGKGRRDLVFHAKKERKIKRILSFVEELGLRHSVSKRKNGFTTINVHLPEQVDYLNIKNMGFIQLDTMSSEKACSFIEELVLWDGSVVDGKPISWYNTNEEAIDKVQAIASLSGKYHASKGINRSAHESQLLDLPQGGKPMSSKTCYRITFSAGIQKTYPYRQEVDYDGKVYCVSVSAENLISRRNGKIAFTGNTIHAVGYALLNDSLGLDNYKAFLNDEATYARIKRMVEVKGKSKQDIARSLAIFSAFVEGVSLFSSFAILLSFSKRNLLKGVGQIIAWSVLDEQLHSQVGIMLFNQLKKEYPEIMDDEFKKDIYEAARTTIKLEDDFIDKVFELGDIDDITKSDLKAFMRYRANDRLKSMGLKSNWTNIDKEAINRMSWFSVIVNGQGMVDFFALKETAYSKNIIDFNHVWEIDENS